MNTKSTVFAVIAGKGSEEVRTQMVSNVEEALALYDYFLHGWGATWVKAVRRDTYNETIVEKRIKGYFKDMGALYSAAEAERKRSKASKAPQKPKGH